MSDTETKTPEPAEEQQQQVEEQAADTEPDQPKEPEAAVEPIEPAEPEASSPQPEPKEEPEASPEETPAEEAAEEKGEDQAVEEAKVDGDGEAGAEVTEQEEKKADVEVEEEEEEEVIEIKPDGNPHWLSNEDVLAKNIPESEVENFKNFHLRHAYSLQASYDAIKEFALETEFITLFKEEIEVLSKEGEVSEEEQQVLNNLRDRINSAIELYNGDGALIKINDRSAKDAMLERSEETFVTGVRDSVINSLEVEKQTVCAYSIWKDIESHPGMLKRGMNKIRASFRRRGSSAATARRRPKLEEDNKDEEAKDEVPPAAAEEGGEPKPAEGEAPPKQEDGETGAKVTVEVQLETEGGEAAAEGAKEEAEAKGEEEASKDEPAKEEAEAKGEEEASKDEPAKEPESEQPKVEEAEPKVDEDKKEEGEGEVQPAEDAKEDATKTEDAEGKSEEDKDQKVKSKSISKKKKPEAEHHKHKAAKDEPLDNRVLRAFGRVMGGLYQVQDGESAVKQLRSSVQIRSCLNSIKPFSGVDDVQVSLSVIRWNSRISDNRGMIFRGFVYNNELCAISQFDDTVYFPNVAHYKDTVIQGKIKNFFDDNIKSILTELKSYIIDFFVGPEKTYVIRLNPFVTSVGACLFIWTDNARELTRGPLQLRVVETPKMSPDGFSSYQENWREMLQSIVTQRTTENRARSGPSCNIL